MATPYMNVPRVGPVAPTGGEAPNAALLIDFDNVTLGMQSDLTRELKSLLDSDVIKGKVTVQRAYADWRRFPQFIVPLSEASVDLIFAPAYGPTKKNATDIRMAIDGIELVFIRPEIGTFILLTGDSDFSSLVLKLKEYGKYVIGIGIQEASSDILVQNCDEYHFYGALTGFRQQSTPTHATKTWDSVEKAVARMAARGDAMRSDRLKQVIIEFLPDFDERDFGFKQFSKFVVEAANKGLLRIVRAQKGQYTIAPAPGAAAARRGRSRPAPSPIPPGGRDGGGRGRSRAGRGAARAASATNKGQAVDAPARDAAAAGKTRASEEPEGPASKRGAARAAATTNKGQAGDRASGRQGAPRREDPAPALDLLARVLGEIAGSGRARVRDSEVKRRMIHADSDFHEGKYGFGKFSKFLMHAEEEGRVSLERAKDGSYGVRLAGAKPAAAPTAGPFDAKALGLPTGENAVKRYLANQYKGVGVKTAARLVDSFGVGVFEALDREPDRIRKLLSPGRADSLLSQWTADVGRRVESAARSAGKSARRAGENRAARTPRKRERGRRPEPKADDGRPDAGAENVAAGASSPAPSGPGGEAAEDPVAEARGEAKRTGLMDRLLGRRRSREPSTPSE